EPGRESRAACFERGQLAVDPRGVLGLDAFLREVDAALDLREHDHRAPLELLRDLAEPTREVGLRESQRTLAAGMDHLEQRLGANEIELALRDRAPRELARLRDARAAVEHRLEQLLQVLRAAVAV